MNSELKQKIDQYQDFPWDSLLRKDLGRYSLEEVEGSFIKTKSYFDTVLKYQPTKNLLNNIFKFYIFSLTHYLSLGGKFRNNFKMFLNE